jgi:HlyD family secretion protein
MRKMILVSLAAALLLGGCSGAASTMADADETATPVETTGAGKVVAEATIEPTRWSELRFQGGGRVADILVKEGDTIEEGDTLARLEQTEAQLAVQEAEFALKTAEAELAVLQSGPRVEEVVAAEARLAEAEAGLERAAAQRDEVTGGGTLADIAAAQAGVTAAEAEWLRSREERDELYRRTDEGNEDDREEREQADYRFHAAREALAAAQEALDARRSTADERVREAEARMASASAQRDIALAELALLKAGTAPWEIASAEARVAQARAAHKRAQAALERGILYAPFAGTVTKVDIEVGELVEPGTLAAVLATVDQLEAHTVDLTELDIARVREGQAALVTADALPHTKLKGRVARIGLRSVEYRGDETYPVIVEFDETPSQFRWGLTAVVEIDVD